MGTDEKRLISVIIPTHNRPDLLPAAIESIKNQTINNLELIIVDDASDPPVNEDLLRRQYGKEIRVVRNTFSQGIAKVRHQGVLEATGKFVVQLDDDDMLATNALEACISTLESCPDAEIAFLGVKGFGKRKTQFDRVQNQAINKILNYTHVEQIETNVYLMRTTLFNALLNSVPMSFQRPFTTRKAWISINELRNKAFKVSPDINDDTQALDHLTDPLNESEWSLYASTRFNSIYINKPLYLQRCEGNSYYSSGQKEQQLNANIKIHADLLKASYLLPELKERKKILQESLSKCHFNRAYYYFNNGNRNKAWRPLLNAMKLSPTIGHLKFAIRMLFPVNKETG